MYQYQYMYLPVKSLTFKCIRRLTKLMKQSKSELKTRQDQEAAPTTSTITSCSQASAPESKAITKNSPETLTSQSPSKSSLRLPIRLVQLIIDLMTQEGIPIRHQVLCELLSNGGCFELELSQIKLSNKFNEKEMKEIVAVLSENCDHLITLTNSGSEKMISQLTGLTSTKLQKLSITITSLNDLLVILSSFPKLISLSVYSLDKSSEFEFQDSTVQKITTFFEELKRPIYSQVRDSLQGLNGLSFYHKGNNYLKEFSLLFALKLISYFPNLLQLDCSLDDRIYNIIKQAREPGYIQDISVDGINLTSTELKNVSYIFLNLEYYTFTPFERISDISVLMPKLRDLSLNCGRFISNLNIGNLKYLNRLQMINHFPMTILPQIGQYLDRIFNSSEDATFEIQAIVRYCPNLVMLNLRGDPHKIRLDQSAFSASVKSTMSKQELQNLERPFRHLRMVLFGQCTDENVIFYILEHALDIEYLEIDVSQMNVEKFAKLITLNPLKELQILHVVESEERPIWSSKVFCKFINSLEHLSHLRSTYSLVSFWNDLEYNNNNNLQ